MLVFIRGPDGPITDEPEGKTPGRICENTDDATLDAITTIVIIV